MEQQAAGAATYLWLGVAIVAEVFGTMALKSSDGFTRFAPTVLTVIGYGIAFYCLSFTLKALPTGVVYAIWSGVGIVLISAVSWWWSRQPLDLPAIIGLGLIVLGVVVVNVFSKVAAH